MQTNRKQYFFTDRGHMRMTTNNEKKFKEKFPAIYNEVLIFTEKLKTPNWSEKVYCYLNNITKKPVCKCGCGKEVEFGKVTKTCRFGYNVFYSDNCKHRSYNGEGNPFYGKNHTAEYKDKCSKDRFGVSWKEKYGKEKAARMSLNLSNAITGENNAMFGKCNYDVWLEKYGKEIADQMWKERSANISKQNTGEKNPMYGRSPGRKAGNSVKCWYKEFFCRSLSELSFIVNYCERFNLTCKTAETEKFKIKLLDGKTYKPDFIVNDKFIVEIKPKSFHHKNAEKFKFIGEEFAKQGLKFKVIDPIKKLVYKDIFKMIQNNNIKIQVVENGKAYNNFMEKYASWSKKQ